MINRSSTHETTVKYCDKDKTSITRSSISDGDTCSRNQHNGSGIPIPAGYEPLRRRVLEK